MNALGKSRRLRELIRAKETLVMPDAFDALSARIIESLGFPAVQCSGFSMGLVAMRPTEADLGRDANLEATTGIRCDANASHLDMFNKRTQRPQRSAESTE